MDGWMDATVYKQKQRHDMFRNIVNTFSVQTILGTYRAKFHGIGTFNELGTFILVAV